MFRIATRSLTRCVVMGKPSTHLTLAPTVSIQPVKSSMLVAKALSSHIPASGKTDKEQGVTSEKKDMLESSKGQIILNGIKVVGVTVKGWVMNPRQTWQSIKDEAHHYWVGSKLLWSEIKVTKQILQRVVQGHELTRRERNQLVRTSTDLFRLIPFAIIVVIPFMELLLPVLLKVFPNMLPSTFEVSGVMSSRFIDTYSSLFTGQSQTTS